MLPWWVIYIAVAAALALINKRRGGLLLIIAGLVVVQAWKFDPLGELIWVAFASTWVVVAGLLMRHSTPAAVLSLISAMCYLIGRVAGLPFAAGDPMWSSILFWADMPIVAAIFVMGSPGVIVGLSSTRRRYLVRRYSRRWNGSSGVLPRVAKEEGGG